MFTLRDLMVGFTAATLTAGAFALQHQMAQGSWLVEWDSVAAKPNASGSVRTFYDGSTATLKRLNVHLTTLNPGAAPHPPHTHPNEEIMIVKQGTLEALINGEWKKVGPGGVLFMASNALHGVRNAGNEPAIYHVIELWTADTPEGRGSDSK